MKSLFGRFSLVVLAMFIASLMFTLPAAAETTYTVVTPNNPDGWQAANVRADATVGITTAQPRGTAPNNLGSLEFTTNTVTNGQDISRLCEVLGRGAGSNARQLECAQL